MGDERGHDFECPVFVDIRHGFQHLYDDIHGAMRIFMWQSRKKVIALCLMQLLDRIYGILT